MQSSRSRARRTRRTATQYFPTRSVMHAKLTTLTYYYQGLRPVVSSILEGRLPGDPQPAGTAEQRRRVLRRAVAMSFTCGCRGRTCSYRGRPGRLGQKQRRITCGRRKGGGGGGVGPPRATLELLVSRARRSQRSSEAPNRCETLFIPCRVQGCMQGPAGWLAPSKPKRR